MKAATIEAYGPAENLKVGEVADPRPGPGQVLIEIHSAAVNPIDWKMRSGKLRWLYRLNFPAILGFDLSGVVREVGPGVSDFQVGDEVYSRSNKLSGESYAELIALDAAVVAPKPKSMNHDEAAGVPLAALTALQGMRDVAGLKDGAGRRVLINGASGGVGGYGVQLARAMGAHVTGVCSGGNVEYVHALGAQDVIDYKSQDPLACESPYDLILDAVASLNFGRARKALKKGGTLVTTMPNGSVIRAMLLGNLFSATKARLVRVNSSGPDLRYLTELANAGQLSSPIDSTFPLADIHGAHKRSEAGRARGKIIVKVR